MISENGATTINPDTNGDLSTLAQLLSGFSGTAVGVVKGDWMALVQAVKNDLLERALHAEYHHAGQPGSLLHGGPGRSGINRLYRWFQ